METNRKDLQQVEKKKYVGNDSIHIVWNENDKEYKPGTITGAFNFVHIIITPMQNGLCRIEIVRKKDKVSKQPLVKFFGPLISGMLLPLDMLPELLRYTTVNGRKSVVYKKMQVFNPITERRKTLEKLIKSFIISPTSGDPTLHRLMSSSEKAKV